MHSFSYFFFFHFILLLNNRSSKTILRELGMKATNYDFDVSMMLLHLIVFKTIAYILLKRRLKTE